MPRSIVILFPHPTAGPTGGYKVVYEYANRLANDGYDVHIVYSGSIFGVGNLCITNLLLV